MARVVRGLWLVARFRADGLAFFGNDRNAVLESLAPLLAFPVLFGLLAMVQGPDPRELSGLLASAVAFLTPLVVSQYLAERWGRGALWPRFAAAFNWCQWAVTLVFLIGLVVSSVFVSAGLPLPVAGGLVMLGVLVYGLTLQWFLARRALQLSSGQAVLLVAGIAFATMVLVMGPLSFASMPETQT